MLFELDVEETARLKKKMQDDAVPFLTPEPLPQSAAWEWCIATNVQYLQEYLGYSDEEMMGALCLLKGTYELLINENVVPESWREFRRSGLGVGGIEDTLEVADFAECVALAKFAHDNKINLRWLLKIP